MLSQFRTLHLRVASSRLDFRIDILKIDPTALRRPSGRRRGRYMTIRECAFYVFESIVNYSLHISEFLGRREPYYCPANVVLDAVKKCYYFNRNGHGFRCRKYSLGDGKKRFDRKCAWNLRFLWFLIKNVDLAYSCPTWWLTTELWVQ